MPTKINFFRLDSFGPFRNVYTSNAHALKNILYKISFHPSVKYIGTFTKTADAVSVVNLTV